jgi:hypothetical protein
MLDVGQFSGQVAHMVVIHERNRPDGFFIVTPFVSYEIVPNEVSDRLGPVRVMPPLDVTVELSQQSLIHRDAEPNQLFHDALPSVARVSYS